MDSNAPVITIDGPAGAGKSTVSCMLARQLNYGVLISGSLYRSIGLYSLRRKIQIEQLPELLNIIKELNVKFLLVDNTVRTILNDEDVTEILQNEECAECASLISQESELRHTLLDLQRDFRVLPGLIADGRDMGTVVFPDAVLKIFLTASLEERARRRYQQLQKQDNSGKISLLYRQLAERDERDQNRHIAPLRPADNAVTIDTTDKNAVLVVSDIITRLRRCKKIKL